MKQLFTQLYPAIGIIVLLLINMWWIKNGKEKIRNTTMTCAESQALR